MSRQAYYCAFCGFPETNMDPVSGKYLSVRRRAILRFVLGQCQVIGAAAALVILLQHGSTALVVWLAVVTGLVSLISIVLFRVVWPEKRGGK